MNKTHNMTKKEPSKEKKIFFKNVWRENSFYSKTLFRWVKLYAKVKLYFFTKCKFINFSKPESEKTGTFLHMDWKKLFFCWMLDYVFMVMIILEALLIKKPNIISHLQFSYLFLRFSKVSSSSSQSL